MSPVSSDISPSITIQRQRQRNALVEFINGSIPCKGGEGEKNPVGKTPTSNNVLLLAGLFEHINNHDCVCNSI
jgi:hypothetical protein